MKTIKFSHNYTKMPYGTKTGDKFTVLEVLVIDNIMSFHGSFLRYDTQYIKEDGNIGFYGDLPSGKVLLIFLHNSYSGLFTTIRRWTQDKENYYKDLIGQEIEIQITE